VQTNPTPAADPDVALFLHGPRRETADVQVCWRGDLPDTENEDEWADILSLCPPNAVEGLPVPLHVFRDWLGSRGKFEDFSSDVGESQEAPDKKKKEEIRDVRALVWRGPDDRFFARHAVGLRPGDTIVLRVQDGGWKSLGHLPEAPDDPQTTPGTRLSPEDVCLVDVAEPASASARRRAVMRIHPDLWPSPKTGTVAAALSEMARDPEKDWRVADIKELLRQLLDEEEPGWVLTIEQRKVLEHLAVHLSPPEPYPEHRGFVLTSHDLLPDGDAEETGEADAEALLEAAQPQELCDHTQAVLDRLESTLAVLPLTPWREALISAAAAHDWGKIDPRFQALLRGTTPFAAMASAAILAKSGSIPTSSAARRAARERAELPIGFRHEMLSVQMAVNDLGATAFPAAPMLRALALHLIAAHHGYARPFAPVVSGEFLPDVSLPMNGETIAVTGAWRVEHPPHALDSGVTERFWRMHRRHGWWGVAFLESVLRLADQAASAQLVTT
jgi:CRISPR-associated endonuclease/helicase Cas3